VQVAVDAAELFAGFDHAGGAPAQRHLPVAPAFDVACVFAADRDHRLDGVGRAQRARQRGWYTQSQRRRRLRPEYHFCTDAVDRILLAAVSEHGSVDLHAFKAIVVLVYHVEDSPDYVVILPRNIAQEVRTQLKDLAEGGARFVIAVPELSFL
jgi:hypothetical protein